MTRQERRKRILEIRSKHRDIYDICLTYVIPSSNLETPSEIKRYEEVFLVAAEHFIKRKQEDDN